MAPRRICAEAYPASRRAVRPLAMARDHFFLAVLSRETGAFLDFQLMRLR